MIKRCLWVLCLSLGSTAAVAAPVQLSQADLDMVNRIRQEAFHHSHVMDIEKHLTEVIGPRLTNSPQNIQANAWAREKFKAWGLSNVHSEAFADFGRGWEFTQASVQMLSPHQLPLHALPTAWTPGTNGPVEGEVMKVSIEKPEDLEQYKGKLAGKILLLDDARDFERPDELGWQRYDAHDLADKHDFEIPGKDESSRREKWVKRFTKRRELRRASKTFFREQGVLATIRVSSSDDGILHVSGSGSRKADEPVGVPSLVMAAERYNQLVRALERDAKVRLRINVKARFTDKTDQPGHNTFAEIAGHGSKRRQVVMLGAHLDSWHAGTGAADNGAGVAVVMEAMRILKKLGVEPRRTIRVALWSGEEQGLLGSQAYVKKHFAAWPKSTDPKQLKLPAFLRKPAGQLIKKDGYEYLSAYYNLDNGSGRIRGIYTQENVAVAPIFKAWLQPFHDVGATEVVTRNTGGTDHLSFDGVGLPGFQFIQDRLDYFSKVHHTNLDTIDHVSAADLKQASAIMATFVYLTAMRDQKMPREPTPVPHTDD